MKKYMLKYSYLLGVIGLGIGLHEIDISFVAKIGFLIAYLSALSKLRQPPSATTKKNEI